MMLAKTEGRPHIPRDGRHCDLCGCSQPAVRCDKCGCQIFCLSCDDMYHRHPKRRFHLRKAVDVTPATCMARPVLPAKAGHAAGDPSKMPLPPPRKKKAPAKSFFDTFRRRSPAEEQHSPPLPKKEYSWTDRFGNIKKFMSNRPLPPLPNSNGAQEEEEAVEQSAHPPTKHDLSFIHKKVDEKPPQLPQRSLKPPEFARGTQDKENLPSPLTRNGDVRNGTLNPSLMNRNNGFGEETQWNNRTTEHRNPNTLMRQPQSGFMYPGGQGYPGNLTMHQSASATDLQNLPMDGQQGLPPQYPHYPMPPPHYPYPMYHPQYPNYPPQYFGNSFANLSSQPATTTDGDFSDQSETSSRHQARKYPFRKRAKRSQSVLMDRSAFPGQFYPFGPFPPGYGPWGAPYPMEQTPPSPASSIRSLNRIGGRTRRRKKATSDDDEEEEDFSSSPLSRTKSSSSERPQQKVQQVVTSTSEEEYEEAEKERSRSRSRSDRVPRKNSDPKKISSPMVRSPQVTHKKFSKQQKPANNNKHTDVEISRQSPALKDRPPSREVNPGADRQEAPTPFVPPSRWECAHCTFLNPSGQRICQVCCKTATADGTALVEACPPSSGGRKQSVGSELSCSSPDKRADEEEEDVDTRRDKRDMAVLNSALDEAEKEISRGLEELMKLKEDCSLNKPESSKSLPEPTKTPSSESLPPTSTKPVYKSSGRMRTSFLDKISMSPSTTKRTTTSSTSTETQTGTNSANGHVIEARRGSTSSTTSEAYNSPMAQSPVDNAPSKAATNKGPGKDTSCQTQTDDLDYMERRKVEEESYFGRPTNGFGYRYGDRVTSPVFDRGYPLMQRSHSRASLFTGRMNDLGPLDYGLGPSPMYRSVSRSSLTGDYAENSFADFHNLRKPAYYLSMEELVERRRQDSIRAQGLELVRMIREAEQQGFTADDIQVALHSCGNQNPMDWLQENWKQLVDQVIQLSASYANDKRENDVGAISEVEARDALRLHKGNIWPAVTECVESRQRKFLELKTRGKFSSKDITDALSANEGDVELAHAKLTKSSSKPFLMRIWGAGEGVQNQDIPPTKTSNSTAKDMEDLYFKGRTTADDVLSDETWDEEDEDVEWDEDYDDEDEEEHGDLEDLQTCYDDVVKTPDSDRSDYCDAFGSNTLERNTAMPEIMDEVPQAKITRRGSFLSKLTGLKKSDKELKQTSNDVDPCKGDIDETTDQAKSYNPISVIKNTISVLRDSVGGSKAEKKLPCAAPERRTIVVKGQIPFESGNVKSMSEIPDSEGNGIERTITPLLKSDIDKKDRIASQAEIDTIGDNAGINKKAASSVTSKENSESLLLKKVSKSPIEDSLRNNINSKLQSTVDESNASARDGSKSLKNIETVSSNRVMSPLQSDKLFAGPKEERMQDGSGKLAEDSMLMPQVSEDISSRKITQNLSFASASATKENWLLCNKSEQQESEIDMSTGGNKLIGDKLQLGDIIASKEGKNVFPLATKKVIVKANSKAEKGILSLYTENAQSEPTETQIKTELKNVPINNPDQTKDNVSDNVKIEKQQKDGMSEYFTTSKSPKSNLSDNTSKDFPTVNNSSAKEECVDVNETEKNSLKNKENEVSSTANINNQHNVSKINFTDNQQDFNLANNEKLTSEKPGKEDVVELKTLSKQNDAASLQSKQKIEASDNIPFDKSKTRTLEDIPLIDDNSSGLGYLPIKADDEDISQKFESLEPIHSSTFKKLPLNKRVVKIQDTEVLSIDTSTETILQKQSLPFVSSKSESKDSSLNQNQASEAALIEKSSIQMVAATLDNVNESTKLKSVNQDDDTYYTDKTISVDKGSDSSIYKGSTSIIAHESRSFLTNTNNSSLEIETPLELTETETQVLRITDKASSTHERSTTSPVVTGNDETHSKVKLYESTNDSARSPPSIIDSNLYKSTSIPITSVPEGNSVKDIIPPLTIQESPLSETVASTLDESIRSEPDQKSQSPIPETSVSETTDFASNEAIPAHKISVSKEESLISKTVAIASAEATNVVPGQESHVHKQDVPVSENIASSKSESPIPVKKGTGPNQEVPSSENTSSSNTVSPVSGQLNSVSNQGIPESETASISKTLSPVPDQQSSIINQQTSVPKNISITPSKSPEPAQNKLTTNIESPESVIKTSPETISPVTDQTNPVSTPEALAVTDNSDSIPTTAAVTSSESKVVEFDQSISVSGLEDDASDEDTDSVTPPSPIDALRHRFEGLVEESSVIRPASPFRRMSFRSRKEAIALERTRDTSTEKPWFLPKPKVFETKKPPPKRSLKQQMETDRKVRKLVADKKVRTYRKAEIVVQLMDLNFEEGEAIQAANECSSFELALSYLQQECLLCTGHFPVSHIISMVHCPHKACRDCIRAYFTVQIRDRNIMELLCPFCNEPDISDEDIAQDYFNHLDMMLKKLVDPEIHELFQRKLRDRVLMRDPSFRWCSKCSSGFLAMENMQRLVCPDCNAVTCASCRRPWERDHQGISCEAFAALKDGTDPEAQAVSLAKLLTENGIDCPRCHFRYALAKGGCMHFRCIQCQHDFCSGCYRPFKMGQKCGVSEFCAKLGLHAHHPRNCLFYLRDKDPEDLQRLLNLSDVKYDVDPPEELDSKSTCQVMEQKETADGMVDDQCGKEVEKGFAGLCRVHYVEYLGQLVNKHKVDPIQIFENDDLELVLRRANVRLPPKRYRETDESYREKLVNLIHEELPLDKMDGS